MMRKEIENWWKQAQADAKTAQNSFSSADFYACVFWCQQSIEKALKALCLLKTKEIPTGHSILYLAQRLKTPIALLSGIRDLNPEYLITRYPDMAAGVPAELYDDAIASRHLQTVKEVLQWARQQMKE